jgi:glyoxylase-like metal-dependent hydrolase (beta-lactamase superfamily II)
MTDWNKPEMRTEIRQNVFCLQADNPSAMTGAGTNTYVLQGPSGAVVIDPGPDLPAHRSAVLAELAGQPCSAILITHAHLDHTEMVPWLSGQTGAPVMSFGPLRQEPWANLDAIGGGEGVDWQHRADVTFQDGMTMALAGLQITAHHTPGHMSGHLCFGYGDLLFSGDHVMGWSSSVVSPPDGDMAAYLRSLHKLLDGPWSMFLAGHGAPILNPEVREQDLIAHRHAREAMILAALQGQSGNAVQIAHQVYTDTAPALLTAAARNVLAHLIDLSDRNIVQPRGPIGTETLFDLI